MKNNAEEILVKVEEFILELESGAKYRNRYVIRDIYNELSIFD